VSDVPAVGTTRSMALIDGLTRTDIVRYAGAAGEFTPVHFDEEAAHAAGHRTVIGQGMLVAGSLGRILTSWFDITEITEFRIRFLAQVWPGDSLTGQATVIGVAAEGERVRVELSLRTTNQDGLEVISGTAIAHLAEC
jgi:acyl dehydratase